jgi:hypothetical protein
MTQPDPSSCRYCGIPEREHMRRWKAGIGWHQWNQPTTQLLKTRLAARFGWQTCDDCKRLYKPEPHNTSGFCSWECFDTEERANAPEVLGMFLGPGVTMIRIDDPENPR